MRALPMIVLTLLASAVAGADSVSVDMRLITNNGIGESVGTLRAEDSPYGLLLSPKLAGLPAGLHGFHVHEKPDCGVAEKEGKRVAGLAAGGHYDPAGTGKHEGPYGAGHLGDLPALFVESDGTADTPLLAPRLKVSGIKGHSLMVHAGGDNYSDEPKKLGGGGARIACGVVP
jgi:Cu-Zn family superoxide dismutase